MEAIVLPENHPLKHSEDRINEDAKILHAKLIRAYLEVFKKHKNNDEKTKNEILKVTKKILKIKE